MVKEKKKEELQKKLVEFQLLNLNLNVLQERIQTVNQRASELQKTRNAIDELKTTKPNKAMIPLGSGNFVFGSVEDSENVIVGIGSGVAIKKKREEAMDILDDKIRESENVLNDLTNQTQAVIERLETLQLEIEKLQK